MKTGVFLVITLYVLISLFQIFINKKQEYFPVYSFKLYSKIPQTIKTRDLCFKSMEGQKNYLLTGKIQLNKIERKFWRTRINFDTSALSNTELEMLDGILKKELGANLESYSWELIDIIDNRYSNPKK